MFDFGSLLALSTMVAVRDYYNDKQKIEREQRHEYRICFESIGDNVELLGNTILATLKRSGRVDLENEIVAGSQEILLYILQEVVRMQGKPITRHQNKIVDICFNNFRFIRINRHEFMQILNGDNASRKKLENLVGISEHSCGVFWKHFTKLMYDTDMSESNFRTIVNCYAEIVCRVTLLGDSTVNVAERIYKQFINGISAQLKESIPEINAIYVDDTDKYKEYINHNINEMKENCEIIAEIDYNDYVLVELFNYFIVSLFIGFLDFIQIKKEQRAEILQELIDITNLEVGVPADYIYDVYKSDEGIKKTFYDSANNWDGANYWKVHLIATVKSDISEMTIEFLDLTRSLMQNIEKYIIKNFSLSNCNGKAIKYMTTIINKMKVLGIGNLEIKENEHENEKSSYNKSNSIKEQRNKDNNIDLCKEEDIKELTPEELNVKYDVAIKKMQSKDILKLQECIFEFEELGEWKDSVKNKEKCTKKVFAILEGYSKDTYLSDTSNNGRIRRVWNSCRRIFKV